MILCVDDLNQLGGVHCLHLIYVHVSALMIVVTLLSLVMNYANLACQWSAIHIKMSHTRTCVQVLTFVRMSACKWYC